MDSMFLLIKSIGFGVVMVALITMPHSGRPMILEAQRQYDKRMKRTLFILLLAAILVTIGFIGQFLQ